MTNVYKFTFNPFQVNTYIVSGKNGECLIIDPGCSGQDEENMLSSFISQNKLKPVMLINTHCHVDHILGNRFINEKYSIPFSMHKDDLYNLKSADNQAYFFGLPAPNSPLPDSYLDESQTIDLGDSRIIIRHTPGHTKGHITLYSEGDSFIICGDVLFNGSIGRTDLPGGNYETLMHSIHSKLLTLPDEVNVYSGHGPATTIGAEKASNPFLS